MTLRLYVRNSQFYHRPPLLTPLNASVPSRDKGKRTHLSNEHEWATLCHSYLLHSIGGGNNYYSDTHNRIGPFGPYISSISKIFALKR
ncbi:hypothetical protein Ancab_025688 [Ancistrocladus abbreviatus]